MKQKVIIDTDPGQDDAMAIMMAVKSQIFDICAITTVAGNSTIDNTTRNARYILRILENKDIPVYSGQNKPLKRKLVQAVVHGTSGLEGIDPKNKPNLTNNAVEKILEIIKNNPNEVTIIALAPLTNIAKAILKDPKIMLGVKEVVIMGGAIKVPGNQGKYAEFNFFVDPEAAKIVFDFPVKKVLVPLDTCNQVQLIEKDFTGIKDRKIKSLIIKMIKPYIRNLEKDCGIKAVLMYDPLTIYYLINSEATKTYSCNINVNAKDLRRGMTTINKAGNKEYVKVVDYINDYFFKKDFIEILNRQQRSSRR